VYDKPEKEHPDHGKKSPSMAISSEEALIL
jgi:hypothetical protein